jgi:hypothetical protein
MTQHGARRRILFAIVTMAVAFVIGVTGLVLVDVYLHHRVQNLGGVNVWGYRGPVVGRKRPGEIRVVAIGGSTAFGFGLPRNEAWPYYLERNLNRAPGAVSRFSVVNLGAPGEGAYGFRVELADYAYLQYDVAIFYEGYNDLGMRDLPEAIPPRDRVNDFLWRRQSPVFAITGYFPVLPLVFREKAMALKAGGDLDGAYRGRTTFKPGLATRTTAAALQAAAAVADSVGAQLGRLSPDPAVVAASVGAGDVETWRPYTAAVVSAVEYARARGVKVLVVTQPYGSDAHVRQQRVLSTTLAERFGEDAGVRYVNLGSLLNLRDREVAYDGLHLSAPANERVAAHLVEPVMMVLKGARGDE